MARAAEGRSEDRADGEDGVDGIRQYLGAWSALSVVQFFAAEAAVIAWWAGPAPYSRRLGFISDLGQVSCGLHGTREICSPLHPLMNVSFVLQGLGMVLAALLITSAVLRVAADAPAVRAQRRLAVSLAGRTTAGGARGAERPGRAVLAAVRSGHPAAAVPWLATLAVRVLLGLAGAGVVVVGLVPQDSQQAVHLVGAAAYFLAGSLALVVLGVLWLRRTAAAWAVLLCGASAFVATVVGGALRMEVPEPGTLERFMGYPITAGIALAGAVIAYRLGVPSRPAARARR